MKRWRRHYEQESWFLREYGGRPVWGITTLSLIILGLTVFIAVHMLTTWTV